MLLPAALAVWGATKLDDKNARSRKTGKTMITVAGVWAGLSILSWAYYFRQVQKMGGLDAAGQPALPPAERKQQNVSKLLGLPKLPG